jgi:ATP-binding cassette subfamily B protein
VRSSLYARTFVMTLALVAMRAQALTYGLGGWFAVRGAISAGTLVSLALLLSIRYGPLSSLANARESIRSALGAAWPYRAAHRPPAVHGSRR